MVTPSATITDFKAQFAREFVYGSNPNQIMDGDVTRALNETASVFNPALWADTTETKIAYCYAAAHFLVLNIQAAGGLAQANTGQGVNSRGSSAVQAKTVGGVSLTYALPQTIVDSPILSGFLRTDFGMRYLQLLTPRLIGAAYVVDGNRESDVSGI